MDTTGSESPKVRSDCVYCGNNPVPHFLYWFFESGNVLLSPFRRFLLYNPVAKWVGNFSDKINLIEGLVKFGIAIGVIGVREDIKACKVRRAQVLWEDAEKRGIEMKELLLLGRPFDAYIASEKVKSKKLKVKSMVFSGLPRPEGYDDRSLDWMDDKAVLKQKFKAAGLPVPEGGSATSFRQAKKTFRTIQESELKSETFNLKSVIVKPRQGSRGRHSTVYVSSLDDLRKAFKVAKQLCHWVVVERQLFGPVYRATLINYELCGVLRGDPPQVLGNGVHAITQLINIKNSQSHPGVRDVTVDQSMEIFLSRQGLTLNSVPPIGMIINLSEKVGVNYGGSSSEDFEICHPDNKELFVKAAKVLGDPIVGFDFIIKDITKSWKEQPCGFIEANSLPFINLHHDPLHGQPRNVAAKVWDMIGI